MVNTKDCHCITPSTSLKYMLTFVSLRAVLILSSHLIDIKYFKDISPPVCIFLPSSEVCQVCQIYLIALTLLCKLYKLQASKLKVAISHFHPSSLWFFLHTFNIIVVGRSTYQKNYVLPLVVLEPPTCRRFYITTIAHNMITF